MSLAAVRNGGPIGILDSGLGGLSVLHAVARLQPQAPLIYLADSACVPYGGRSDTWIRERVALLVQALADAGCGVVVVACNTATVHAIRALRQRFPGRALVGVEPGVKPAAAASRARHIAVLATEATCRSERLQALIAAHAPQCRVDIQPCPGWANRVEALDWHAPAFADEVQTTVAALVQGGADQLVLGCTHYSFLAPLMVPALQGRAELVDVADAVARRVASLWTAADDPAPAVPPLQLWATARPEALSRAYAALALPDAPAAVAARLREV